MSTASTKNDVAIDLQGVSRRYGLHYVLKDIYLSVNKGRVLALHGSNGTGKTTLLKVLSTKLRPSKGTGTVMGHDLLKEADKVREHSAYLSVLGGSYSTLTAYENLKLAAELYNADVNDDDLYELLERVALLEAKDKFIRTFSSGMKKRLGIAKLLLSDADLWLLDEPYAALDENGRELIDDLLHFAKTQGKTVIMASHELERSRHFSDAVLHLEQGKLSLEKIKQETIIKPLNNTTAGKNL